MAHTIPREFIDLLLTKIDLVDLISSYLPLQKKSGSNYFSRCPFHDEKSASFSVSQPKQFYHCFGCGAHGNAIDFTMQQNGLTFPEAIEELAHYAGMEMPTLNNGDKKDDPLPALFNITKEAAQFFYDAMRKSPRAIDYLKGRGISGSIAQQFLLGYAPSGWSHLLDQYGATLPEKKILLDAGLIIKKSEGGFYDRFRDRIMFPIHDFRGRIIGFGGRVLDQGEPKYLNSPETPLFQKGHELYGLYQALKQNRKLERVVMVEGYMDVIALFQHGITYAVATLGTATTVHHLQRLFRYTTEIVVCFDGDDAGRTAAWRALQVIFPIMQDSIQVRFLFLPDGEDPDTLVQKEGKAAFENRLETALSLSAFFFQVISKSIDLTTMEGRAQLAASALNHIKVLPAGILSSILLDELSKRARIDIAELRAEAGHPEKTQPITFSQTLSPQTLSTKLPAALRLSMVLLVQYPHLSQLITAPLPESHLPGYAFFLQLIEKTKNNPNITTGGLIEHWRGEKEEKWLLKLANWEHLIPETSLPSEFQNAVKQIICLCLDMEINQLLAKASQGALSDSEKQVLSDWINKKKSILDALKSA